MRRPKQIGKRAEGWRDAIEDKSWMLRQGARQKRGGKGQEEGKKAKRLSGYGNGEERTGQEALAVAMEEPSQNGI